MIHIDLDPRDAMMLSEILTYDLSELGSEIRNTDAREYRDRLKLKQAFLQKLINQLEECAAA